MESGNVNPNTKRSLKRQKIHLDKKAHQLAKKAGRAIKNEDNRNAWIARENDQVAILLGYSNFKQSRLRILKPYERENCKTWHAIIYFYLTLVYTH